MIRKARLEALLGADLATREVYRVRRGLVAAADLPRPGGRTLVVDGGCIRCGAPAAPGGSGMRAVLTVLTRQRGTLCSGVAGFRVHVGCIPGDEVPERILPRKVRR
jgi:hypothetical protein